VYHLEMVLDKLKDSDSKKLIGNMLTIW